MRRYLYRCPVCRTTSGVRFSPAESTAEGEHHRLQLHAGHYPDGEHVGEIDRQGRWYTDMGPLTALHTRLADTYADLRDPKGIGGCLWAAAFAWVTLAASGLTVLWTTAAA
ncbi:hypothetical protein, partial [Streptomyces albipurpureus]